MAPLQRRQQQIQGTTATAVHSNSISQLEEQRDEPVDNNNGGEPAMCNNSRVHTLPIKTSQSSTSQYRRQTSMPRKRKRSSASVDLLRQVFFGLLFGGFCGFFYYTTVWTTQRHQTLKALQSSWMDATVEGDDDDSSGTAAGLSSLLVEKSDAPPICQCIYQLLDRAPSDPSASYCPRQTFSYEKIVGETPRNTTIAPSYSETYGADLHMPITPGRAAVPSSAQVWEHMREEILKYTIADVEDYLDTSNNAQIRSTLTQFMKLFSTSRMRRSLIHPMSERDTGNLLKIIQKRLEDPVANPPLRIVALGGSVVEGVDSAYHQWDDLPQYEKFTKHAENAWPHRLQNILNHVVFNGHEVVEVVNLGNGGISSDVAAPIVYYGQFARELQEHPPDMFILAFTNNDIGPMRNEAQRLHISEELIMAIRHLRCDSLPIAMFYEDPYWKDWGQLKYHSTLAKTTRWHDAMGVSYGKAFNDLMYTTRKMTSNDGEDTPWWYGAPAKNVHPGLVYHATTPWLLAYNFIKPILEHCEEAEDTAQPLIDELSAKELRGGLDVHMMPEMVAFKEPGYLLDEWTEAQRIRNERCATDERADTCSYAWMVGKLTGITSADRVKEFVENQMVKELSHGWEEEKLMSKSGRQRPGWTATKKDDVFVIDIEPKAGKKINYVTVIYIKSYGENWVGSRADIRLDILKKKDDKIKFNSTVLTHLIGHHASGTSTSYVEKIKLSEGGAMGGEKVRATFKLAADKHFTIKGLLFCDD
mmetsp:Transcript_19480/g.28821  ORF Transcript_19480/g.28821 Transcript_19480/m.28821 type:complete len:757 (-) Transcript_19480:57-2327(-)